MVTIQWASASNQSMPKHNWAQHILQIPIQTTNELLSNCFLGVKVPYLFFWGGGGDGADTKTYSISLSWRNYFSICSLKPFWSFISSFSLKNQLKFLKTVFGPISNCSLKANAAVENSSFIFTICIKSVPLYHFKLGYVVLHMAVKEFFQTHF